MAKKIPAEKYVEGVESIYVEQPDYQEGHDGSDGTCDCIGMCRGGLERGGATGVTNMRGTNQAARKAIEGLGATEADRLRIGDVVLKTRDKDDKKMPLPDRYRKGGADYDAKVGETNFTHIGTVTGLDPIEITHMTSPTAKKDYTLKGWSWMGNLPWVEYGGEPVPEKETATVTAEKGDSVKMRAKPSTSCRLYWDVPVGSVVVVDEIGTPWSRITWNGITGYMMTKFLLFGGETELYTVSIPNLEKAQAEELCRAWDGATMTKQ